LALPTNIRLGWKGLPGTNALAYFEKSQLTAVQSFITLATGILMYMVKSLTKRHISFYSKMSKIGVSESIVSEIRFSGEFKLRRNKIVEDQRLIT